MPAFSRFEKAPCSDALMKNQRKRSLPSPAIAAAQIKLAVLVAANALGLAAVLGAAWLLPWILKALLPVTL